MIKRPKKKKEKRTRIDQVLFEVRYRQSILTDPHQNAWKHFATPKENNNNNNIQLDGYLPEE